MSITDEVDGCLRDVGRRLGVALHLDPDGRCGFAFGDGLVGVVAVLPGSDDVLFHATMIPGGVRSAVSPEDLLALNLHGSGTDGATLGRDPLSGDVVLARRWPWGMVRPDGFGALLGNFIATATRLHAELNDPAAGVGTRHGDSPAADSLLANMQWRI